MNWTPPAFPTPPVGNSTNQPATTEFVTNAIGSSSLTTFTDFVSGLIISPTNQDYRIIERLPFAITVTSFAAKLSTGQLTVALSINGTTITNGSIAGLATTQTVVTPTALNTAAVGSTLVVTASATSGPLNLSFTVGYTRSP